MSQQLFYQGYSEYELEALGIPNQLRGQCLPHYVPYIRCLLNANSVARWAGKACQDEKAPYFNCRKIERSRVDSTHLMSMKQNNPKKFEELNVAPALSSQYQPSILNWTRH